MKTFYDLMVEMQQGALSGLMSSEFGLSADQQAKAFEALMPAFWLGFRQRAADPFGFTALWQSLASGRHKSYVDNPFSALSSAAVAEGNGLLERLFGSKEMAQAVALQVEAATGIAQDVVRRMMPVIANMMAGGIERQAEGFENPFLRAMQGGQAPPKSTSELPFVTMMQAFFGGPSGIKPPATEPQPTINEEMIDRLFDASRNMQSNYVKSLEMIFERFNDNKPK